MFEKVLIMELKNSKILREACSDKRSIREFEANTPTKFLSANKPVYTEKQMLAQKLKKYHTKAKELEIEKNQLLQQIEAMKEDKLQFGRDKDRFIEDYKCLIKHLKDENQKLREENSCKPALTNNQQPKKNGIYFFSKYYGVE